jgi:hypothetical protein
MQVYGYNFASIVNSDSAAVHNVTLFSAPGMGVYTNNVSGERLRPASSRFRCHQHGLATHSELDRRFTGVDLDGLRVLKASGRPMSITADGTHFSNSRGGSVLVRRW